MWQGASKLLSKDVNKKHRNNLSIGQRNSTREIKNDTNIIDYDPTTILSKRFQKELAKLRKKGKFDNKTYYKLYPSDAIPRQYGVIKLINR